MNNKFADKTLALLGKHSRDMTVFFDALTGVAGGESEQPILALFANQSSGILLSLFR